MKQSRKIFSFLLLLAFLIQGTLGMAAPASALFGVSIPSPSQIMDQAEKRYNLNPDAIRDQAQKFNVIGNKQLAPQIGSVVFSPSDPREGQRITAKAFPLYFNGPQEQLYYTWYLKRADCDLTNNPSATKRSLCDEDDDGDVTVEDWKIAAMGEIARNNFNNGDTTYSTDTDNDGYQARFGGSAQANVPNHCYFQDRDSGQDYEIADASETEFTCPDGKDPVCVVTDQVIESGQIPASTGGDSSAANIFEASDGDACYVAGAPICNRNGSVSCSVGTPKCIDREEQNDCGSSLTACTTTTLASVNPICRHLFPDAPGYTSGDGSFGLNEERFWRTNPADDSTADNGTKDEANIVGLGRTDFTWNYLAGDKVGVVVEGTSTFPTKHDDSSFAVMWAFSNNNCPISAAEGTGSYTKTVKNYQVTFPTVNIDLNDCLERNLIDPTQGGQSTNLDLQMVTSPENPVNDETSDKGGDVLTVQTIVNNGQKGATNQLFEWTVEVANNPQFNNAIGTVADITEDLQNAGLLRQSEGTGLDAIDISLNMARNLQLAGRNLSSYLSGDQGYLRVSVRASENFSNNIVRKGSTNVIVPFTSTRNKIIAYKARPVLVGNTMRVEIPGEDGIICQDARIDRAICRVVKNEIIGMKIDASGLSNFQWSINDTPLQCFSGNVSPSCETTTQNEVNFFPASGGVGSSYTVTVTANDIQTGKTVTLSRLFQVVDPTVAITSGDPAKVLPKFIGQYRDLRGEENGCPEGYCSNYSKSVFQGYAGETLKLKALFIPSFLKNNTQLEWEVNGQIISPANPTEITIDADRATPGDVTNVTLRGVTIQDDNTRRALADTWGISQLDSAEQRFENSIQVEIIEDTDEGELAGVRRYFAAFGTYIPETALYTLRMLLSGGLVLFVAAAAFIFIPDPASAPERVPRREE